MPTPADPATAATAGSESVPEGHGTTKVWRRFAGYSLATSAGMALFFLASPFLTRIYSPIDFGVFGLYAAAVGLLGVVSTLRYELAIVLPKEMREAWVVAMLSARSVAALTVLAGVVLAALHAGIPSLRGLFPASLVWAVPAGALLAGLQSTATYLSIRSGDYRSLGRSKVLYGAVGSSAQICLGLWVGPLGLVLGDLVGRVAGLLPLVLAATRTRPHGAMPTRQDLRRAARRFAGFAKLSTPSAAINNLGLFAPAVLMTALYGAASTGWFVLGQRMVGIPSSLVGDAAGQVYTGAAAKARHDQARSLETLYLRASAGLAILGVPVLAAIAFAGPAAFAFVFGPQWADAGSFARLLALGYAGQFIVAPVSLTLSLLELQSWQLGWDVVRLVAVAGSMLLAAGLGASDEATVLALSLAMVASYALLWAISFTAVRRHSAGSLPYRAPGGG